VKKYYIFHIFREIGSKEGGRICTLTWTIFSGGRGRGDRTSEARIEVCNSRTYNFTSKKCLMGDDLPQRTKMIKDLFHSDSFYLLSI